MKYLVMPGTFKPTYNAKILQRKIPQQTQGAKLFSHYAMAVILTI